MRIRGSKPEDEALIKKLKSNLTLYMKASYLLIKLNWPKIFVYFASKSKK